MTFWIIIIALAIVVTLLLALAVLRGKAAEEPPAAYDLRVYRDQLKEVERDLARGVVSAEDAERVRTEISRRILAADSALQATAAEAAQPRPLGLGLIVLLAATLIGGSAALYWQLGAPGYGDLARKDRLEAAKVAHDARPKQAEAEARVPPGGDFPQPAPEFLDLMEKLRNAVAARPDDLNGHQLLARNEAALGNFSAAHAAQARVLALKGEAATAQDYLDYADMLILAANGYVSPEAETALQAALARDPENGPARYYYGLMLVQSDRADLAFQMWEALLRKGPAEAPWIAPIRAQIEEIALRAGVEYELPGSGLRGPSAADVTAAGDMSEEDRQAMIRTMVSNLSERLATEGGTPAEWARLIGAYGVLGESDRAAAIWAEAQQVFAGKPDALEEIRAGAIRAGVAE